MWLHEISGMPIPMAESLTTLPDEIMLCIIDGLPLDTRITLAATCWRLRALASDHSLYTSVRLARRPGQLSSIKETLGAFLGTIVPAAGKGIMDFDCQSLGSSFNDDHLAQLARWCPNLRSLNASGTAVTDRGMRYLSGLISFQSADAVSALQRNASGVPQAPHQPDHIGFAPASDLLALCKKSDLSSRCPKLQTISLCGLRGITNHTLCSLAATLTDLRHLNISHCPNVQITSSGVETIVAASPLLETLNISGCSQLDDETLLSISFAACRNTITIIDASGCHRFSSSAVRCILSSCQNLQVLSLDYCWRVGDDAFIDVENEVGGIGGSVISIPIKSKVIRRISLSYCYTISDHTALALSRLGSLEHVDLFNTAVSDDAREALQSKGVRVGDFCHVTGNNMASPHSFSDFSASLNLSINLF